MIDDAKKLVLATVILGLITISSIFIFLNYKKEYTGVRIPAPAYKVKISLANYSESFNDDVMIVLSSNASYMEMEGARLIANKIGEEQKKVPLIKKDSEITESEKNENNLIVIGKPGNNKVLDEFYQKIEKEDLDANTGSDIAKNHGAADNADDENNKPENNTGDKSANTGANNQNDAEDANNGGNQSSKDENTKEDKNSGSAEVSQKGKGVLEVKESPWNKNKVVVIITGSDETGIRAGQEKISDNKTLEDSPKVSTDWKDVEIKQPDTDESDDKGKDATKNIDGSKPEANEEPDAVPTASPITSEEPSISSSIPASSLLPLPTSSELPRIFENNYELITAGDLFDDKGDFWLLYDHDSIGDSDDPYFKYSQGSVVVKLNPTSSVKYFTNGVDWRAIDVAGSIDGEKYETLKNSCCYPQREYEVNTYKYLEPFYLKFTLSTGACCGPASYITLSKKILSQSNKCIDSDGGKNYFMSGSVSGSDSGLAFNNADSCADSKTLLEQYCDDQHKPAAVQYACADKCAGGKCIIEPNASLSFWQFGKSGMVNGLDLSGTDEELKISFGAMSAHPYTGDAYLVSSMPQNMTGKKFEATTDLGKTTQRKYGIYDENSAVIAISPEKYLDADLMNDAADNSNVHFTNAIRCFSQLSNVNSGKIDYICAKSDEGKASNLFAESISQSAPSAKAQWIFDFKNDNTLLITAKIPGKNIEFLVYDSLFLLKFAAAHIYLGEYSSSGEQDGVIFSNIFLGGEKFSTLFGFKK